MLRGLGNIGHRSFVAIYAGITLALCLWAPEAGADQDFCPPGTGAGQCAVPAEFNSLRSLAVDFETGRLYVADRDNNRIDVFEEDGSFLFAFGYGVDTGAPVFETCTEASTCQTGIAGLGAGQFKHPDGIAVDNGPGSATPHSVYVVDSGNSRVEKFNTAGVFIWARGSLGEAEGQFQTGISAGVGPGGTLYVLDNLPLGNNKFKHRLQRYDAAGNLLAPQCILFEGRRAVALAVEPDGSFWVGTAEEGLRKYNSACAQIAGPVDQEAGLVSIQLARDESERLFAVQSEDPASGPGFYYDVTAHDASGAILSRFGYDRLLIKAPEGLAVDGGVGGGVFASLKEVGIRRLDSTGSAPNLDLPPPGPITVPSSVELTKVGSTDATGVAEVNPEGKVTGIHVEYLTQKDYEDQGNSFAGPATEKTDPVTLGSSGFIRLAAAEIPFGCPDPASEAGLPGNDCLTPETKYRWRVVATNADGGGEGTVQGTPFETGKSVEIGAIYATGVGNDSARLSGEVNPHKIPASGFFEYVDDARFQTSGFDDAVQVPDVDEGQAAFDFGAGEAFLTRSVSISTLSPGTTYHFRLIANNPLVPKPEVSEAETFVTFSAREEETCANDSSRIGSGALLPDCRAYEMVSPLDKGGGDIRASTTTLEVPAVLEQSADSGDRLAYGAERSFGDEPSSPFTSQYIANRIAGAEWQTHGIDPPRGRPLYDAPSQFDTEFKAFSTDLCQGWIATYAETDPPLGPGGFADRSNLYRRTDRLCGPERYETVAPVTTPPGKGFDVVLQGVSEDGTHAIFITPNKLVPEGVNGDRELYESPAPGDPPQFVCILPDGTAINSSCTAGSSEGGSPHRSSLIGAISDDGERIFWSDTASGDGKLYVRIGGTETVAISKAAEEEAGTSSSWFWAAGADGSRAVFSTGSLLSGAKLYSFAVDGKTTTKIAEGVLGVLGVGDNGKRVYFVSDQALTGDGEAGEPNLYLYEEGAPMSFVATLASADLPRIVARESLNRNPRVTPDGAHAAFVSVAPLTGYDNNSAASGAPTAEIYRYDAGSKKLLCVSCNPSGARPAGSAAIPAFAYDTHAARVMSDDGSRLYFDSADALVGRDSNGRVDVYQWEAAGTGSCRTDSADFSAASEGCVELISSGQSGQDSRFVEANPDGHDVFFATGSSLLPQDYGLFDIYDARVGGGLPVPPPPPPPCEGDACHPQIAAPALQTPGSFTYTAPLTKKGGNGGPCAKGRRKATKKGRPRCVPRSHRHTRHQRRAGR